MSDEIDPIARAGAKPKGKRPQFFDQPETDRILSILMAVAGEVSVMRERMDTIERLLDAKGSISRADIENYVPDRQAGQERGLLVKEYLARILRGVQQDMESLTEKEPSVEQLSRDLRDM